MIEKLVWLFGLPHEVVHCLVARALGINCRIHSGYVLYEMSEDWKAAVVSMAPLAVGLLCWGASLAGWVLFARTRNEHLFWSSVAWVCFWGCLMCAADMRNFLIYLRTGEWPSVLVEDTEDGRENVERR